ncbi:thiol-disulfide oxidoreductase DCC family protein [Methylobacterium brachythecii]|nr:DCC1-like thiol-disulfide oxidoreductase family protein [Methylobacterium brachythecii]MBB3905715.1 putative DCC family thiol-disulfide oxidoreductase YuxK [Methylobacterium brachythecii]
MQRPPHSYRDDPSVPVFPDELPIVVFDGVCGLCSRLVRFTLWFDGPRERHRFIAAQSPLGEALFRHYGLRYDVYETVLLITGGRCLMKSEAVLALLGTLGPPWSWLAQIGTLVPSPLRNATYDVVATNRYRIWGRTDVCRRPPPGAEARFLG